MPKELTLTVSQQRIAARDGKIGQLYEVANLAAVSKQNARRLEVGLRPEVLGESLLFGGWQAQDLDWVEPFSPAGFDLDLPAGAVLQLILRAQQALHPGQKTLPPLRSLRLQLYIPNYDAISPRLRRRFELDLALLPEIGWLKINARPLAPLCRQARWGRRILEAAHWLTLLLCLFLFDLAFRGGAAWGLLAGLEEPLKTIAAIGLLGASLLLLYLLPTRAAALLWALGARRALPPDLAVRLIRADFNLHTRPDWLIRLITR